MGKIGTIIISSAVTILTLIGISCLIAYKCDKSKEKTNKNRSFPEANIDLDKKKENSLSLKDELNNNRKRALLKDLDAFNNEKKQYEKKMRKAELYGNKDDKIKIKKDYMYKIDKYLGKFKSNFSKIDWTDEQKERFEENGENFLIRLKRTLEEMTDSRFVSEESVANDMINNIHSFIHSLEFELQMDSLRNRW